MTTKAKTTAKKKPKVYPRKDHRGEPLAIGDLVHFATTGSGYLDFGPIVAFSNQGARIQGKHCTESRPFRKIGKITIQTPVKSIVEKARRRKNEGL